MCSETPGVLELGSYVLDREAQRLFRCERVSLPPRTEAVLLALAGRPGEVVTDGSLFETWSTTVEQETNLAAQIKTLRKKVGDTEKRKERIQRDTEKRGYRLVYDERIGDLIRFGNFLLDPKTPRLWKAEPVPLDPMSMRILSALAERPGEPVEEQTLLRRAAGVTAGGSSAGMDLEAEILRLNEVLSEGETRLRIRSATGYLLSLEASAGNGASAGRDEPAPRPQAPGRIAAKKPGSVRVTMPGIGVGLAAAGLAFWALLVLLRAEEPALTLACAPVIESHEQRIFGNLRLREPDAAIVGYVLPEDGRNHYYRQESAKIDGDDWWLDARFGNEEGQAMEAALPLHYRAFAVYVSPASLARSLEATWGKPEVEAPSDQAFVQRLREVVEKRKGTFEVSNSCRVYRTAARDCTGRAPTILNPTRSAVSTSPVAFRWSGEKPMYLELRRNSAVIEVGGSPERPVLNGVSVDLETGRYELKVSAEPSLSCPAIVWFDVAREESTPTP